MKPQYQFFRTDCCVSKNCFVSFMIPTMICSVTEMNLKQYNISSYCTVKLNTSSAKLSLVKLPVHVAAAGPQWMNILPDAAEYFLVPKLQEAVVIVMQMQWIQLQPVYH